MQCPACDHTMIGGRLSLRAQWLARVVFSPAGLRDGFRQRYLRGTFFDSGLRPGEADLISNYWNSPTSIALAGSMCPSCGTFVVPGRRPEAGVGRLAGADYLQANEDVGSPR